MGSCTFTLTAAMRLPRTSAGSNCFLKNSRHSCTMASRKAAMCVPPWVVCWPLTKL
jgi:hypothetical protein